MRSAVRVCSSAPFSADVQVKRKSMEGPRYRVGTSTGSCTSSICPGRLSSPSGASLMSENGGIAPQVNPDRNLRTLIGSAHHLDLPTQTFDPLAHRGETHAGPHRGGIEPSAVVNNFCEHLLVLRSQPYLDATCSGMAPSVGEGLLQYAQHVYTFPSRETYREPFLDDYPYLALVCRLTVEIHQRFNRLQERPLLLAPEIVDGTAQTRARSPECFELLPKIQPQPRTFSLQVG